ncbi:MAG TPA: alpha/beta hydrolase [Clostridia bacterium]|nr:alpha/beta hydrolase [Clostridia bacterium]HZJ83096.1 alpha/beta hydrolase [Clostridia bacterium]
MSYNRFDLIAGDGTVITVHKWGLEEGTIASGVVQIAHGMAEWAYRYDYFAKALNRGGYIVYANDHRGHGLTALKPDDIGYISDNDGFIDMVEDMRRLNILIQEEYPTLPIVLFGHSMGSFLSQRFIQLYGSDLSGVILSGSNGKQGPIINLGITLAYMEMKIRGRRHKSRLLDNLSFGTYNKAFAPNRTKFDWLSRDEEQVDRYMEDPYCGGIFTSSFFYDFLRGLKNITKMKNLKDVPKDLPIYIFSGSMDPVGGFSRGVERLVSMYKNLGLKRVSRKLYPKGRHEMLKEINKDEVIGDIIEWLNEI